MVDGGYKTGTRLRGTISYTQFNQSTIQLITHVIVKNGPSSLSIPPLPIYSTRGMVAASQPQAVAAGLEILSAGGNAADAAVAVAAALNVTEPTSTGLGGDAFALFYDSATRQVSAINGSGRAPGALSLERLTREGYKDQLPPISPL